MNYFNKSEYQCRCGGCPQRDLDTNLLIALNFLRDRYGKPIYISSGLRCEEHNKAVGGVGDSAHITGHAVDIFCTNPRDRFLLLKQAMGLFNRVGLGTTFLHFDNDEKKDQEVIWLYGNH